jgi:hypothetical protein
MYVLKIQCKPDISGNLSNCELYDYPFDCSVMFSTDVGSYRLDNKRRNYDSITHI